MRRLTLLCLLLVTLFAPPSPLAAGSATAMQATAMQATGGCTWLWETMATPNPGGLRDRFFDIEVRTPSDVWAVGDSSDGWYEQTLVAHYDGTAWSQTPSPNLPGVTNSLRSVALLADGEAWAVGDYDSEESTLALHYAGGAWTGVTTPNAGRSSYLNAVAAVSPTDVWAVGAFSPTSGGRQTLIEHFDGSSWTIVASPNWGYYNSLGAVAVVAADDIWAAGYGGDSGLQPPLVLHYDGATWSRVAVPGPGGDSVLTDFAVVSPTDIWAVGSSGLVTKDELTLVMHYDGSEWSIVPSPNAGTETNILSGIVAISAGNMVAVGTYAVSANVFLPLVERWDGTSWTVIDTGIPSGGLLWGAAVDSAGRAYIAGQIGDYYHPATLVQRGTFGCHQVYLPLATWIE